MRTEIIIINKKINIGTDENKNNVYLTLDIKEVNKNKTTIEHKEITKYKTLSISGSSKNYAGQIQDKLRKWNKSRLKQIIKIWDEWHLNDLQPNCIHQKSFNVNNGDFTEKALIETKKCPLKYSYGSKWLIKEIPEEIIFKIIELFNNYESE